MIDRVCQLIDSYFDDACQLALALHQEPEVPLSEFRSAERCCELLHRNGFDIETGSGGLDTAFVAAVSGELGLPAIGLVAEYDALPELGHACGHNLIAGAVILAAVVLKKSGLLRSPLKVFGTPAEETGVGKEIMLQAGVFDNIGCCLSFHPWSQSGVMVASKAARMYSIGYTGKPSHASDAPWDGVNALEAVLMLFALINTQRSGLRESDRFHGIISEGGSVPNIVPEKAVADLWARASNADRLRALCDKLEACATGAATASGAKVKIDVLTTMLDVVPDPALYDLAKKTLETLGLESVDWVSGSSTDFGNISHKCPSCLVAVKTWGSDVPFHTVEAAKAAASTEAFEGMRQAATALALIALEWEALANTVEAH